MNKFAVYPNYEIYNLDSLSKIQKEQDPYILITNKTTMADLKRYFGDRARYVATEILGDKHEHNKN